METLTMEILRQVMVVQEFQTLLAAALYFMLVAVVAVAMVHTQAEQEALALVV
jgi:hypothetical protein